MKKKLLSSILCASLILSGVQITSLANEEIIAYEIPDEKVPEAEAVVAISEPTPELMEEAIKKVRPFIDVPEEYTEFNWDYRTGYADKTSLVWRFNWTDNETGEISVQADDLGRITSYTHYKYNKDYSAALPSVSPESLVPVAEAFMKKTAPYLDNLDLRLEEVGYPSISYNHNYTYYYIRYENDIPIYDNTISVTVNHLTKEVEGFSAIVDLDISFENPDGGISEDEAKEILSGTQKMVLSYRLKTEYDDDGKLESRKAYLVYTPELSYVSVDAASGKVYTERNTWAALRVPEYGFTTDSSMKEESAESENFKSAAGSLQYQLSEKELEQLEVLEKLITKDEATKVILESKDLYIAENAYLADAQLSKHYGHAVPILADGETEDRYVWNLYFSVPEKTYLGMNAVVDAQDGSLISFNAELPYAYHYEEYELEEPEIKYTEEQAIEIASEFIKKMQPEKAKDVVYSDTYEYAPYKYIYDEEGRSNPCYRANRLTFVRQNEGVDFTYNSFNMGVDRSTGKITRYSYTWYDDVEFESPKDAIGEKQALMALYSYDGFGINYEVNRNYTYIEGKYESVSAEKYSRAVYSAYNLGTTTIRALDGKMIDYSGEEYIGKTKKGPYTDIENHWSRDTVIRFTWIGHGPEGTKFNPDEIIDGEEFIYLFEIVGLYGREMNLSDNDNLTRMQAVKHIISSLGYKRVAELENVFITDFVDNSDFLPEDIGYAAIARGFGLIEGDGENFRPYDTLTRAEAYTMAENIIELGILDR